MSVMHQIILISWFAICLSTGVAFEGWITRPTPASFLRTYLAHTR